MPGRNALWLTQQHTDQSPRAFNPLIHWLGICAPFGADGSLPTWKSRL